MLLYMPEESGFKNLLRAKHAFDTVEDDDDKGYLPTVHIDSKHLAEIKDWKVGETYVLKVRQVSRTEEKDGSVHASFEVVGSKTDGYKKDDDRE